MNAPLKTLAGAAIAALALGTTACKCSPCSPPAALAEVPPCAAPEPMPLARTTMPRAMPAPLPPVPPPSEPEGLGAMRSQMEARQRRIAELEAEAARLESASTAKASAGMTAMKDKARAEEMARHLADELKGIPGAQVLVEGTSAVVILSDSFAPGSDKLKTDPNVRAALRAVSMAIARHADAKVSVTGHTDSTPIKATAAKWPDNTALSKARAEAVAGALTGDGVTRDRLAVSGVGEKDPLVVPEQSSTDRAKNRRVEIEFAFPTRTS
jgi:flagellar motor protein MotB